MKTRAFIAAIHIASLVGILSVFQTTTLADSLRTQIVGVLAFAWILTLGSIMSTLTLSVIHRIERREKVVASIIGLVFCIIYIISALIASVTVFTS